MTTMLDPCAHQFDRFLPWPSKLRYRCVNCGFISRRYDAIDARMTRPVHPYMSVVVHGYNTIEPLRLPLLIRLLRRLCERSTET